MTDDQTHLSIHDFVATVDTRASGGDKVVLHLDRDGQPRLTIACSASQLLWIVDDSELFINGYRSSLARNIISCHERGWSFEAIARELGVDVPTVHQMYAQAVAAAEEAEAEKAREVAEVGV